MVTPDPYGHYRGDFDPNGRAQLNWTPNAGTCQLVAHVVEHSSGGLSWGYNGNGPSDAALSILVHATRDRDLAHDLAQQFRREFIATFEPNEPFQLPGRRVVNWLHAHGVEPAGILPQLPGALVEHDQLEFGLVEEAEFLDARERSLHAQLLELEQRQLELDQLQLRLDAQGAALRTAIDVQPAWSLPARPLVEQIEWLQHGTGDTLEVIAKGLDVEDWWARSIVNGKIGDIDIDHVQRICESLHCSPYDLWGARDARTILHAYGPELWPRFIEPLGPPEPEQSGPRYEPPTRPQGPTLER